MAKEQRAAARYFDISFSDNAFDCVLATFPHASDLLPAAREIARCLVPGGRFVIVDAGPHRSQPFFQGQSTGYGTYSGITRVRRNLPL
ncbi:methyltransferase domain-containing protein [candidate division WOR-3 bacterium]|nr:methyltransferase domain-containing protein [candidate division WOR-3 bacterium]